MEEKTTIDKLNNFSSKNFLNYRINNEENLSKIIEYKNEDKCSQFNEYYVSTFGADSAYNSGYSNLSITPHSTTLSSSQFSTYSSSATPSAQSSYQQQSNNLDNVCENSIDKNEILTLTPVTQNAQRISAFHITTPKNEPFCYITKRSSNYSLEEFQSTPKKFKSNYDNIYSTPQKHKREKINLLQRLHSAPDFENNNKQDEVKFLKTPAQSTPKRTPLLPNRQITHCSTPRNASLNLSKQNLVTTPLNRINENSLNNLLNCSNDVFESILNSDCLSSPRKTKIDINKRMKNVLSNENDFQSISCLSETDKKTSCKKFRRFLKFSSQNNTLPILNDELKSENTEISSMTQVKRKNFPAIHSVIHDRLKAKKRVNAERLANLNRQNYPDSVEDGTITANLNLQPQEKSFSLDKLNFSPNSKLIDMELSPIESIKKINKKCKIETPINSKKISDMEISPILRESICSNNRTYDMDISPITSDLKFKECTKEEICTKLLQASEENSLDDFIPLTSQHLHKTEVSENIKLIENNVANEILKSEKLRPRKLSTSSSTSQKSTLCVIDKEKFQILYPSIPETPNKKNFVPSSPKKSPKKIKKLIRKTQPHVNRIFYNGSTFLNIIAKLESYTVVLENIFKYLSDKDLLNLSMTTKVYRSIIHDNFKANKRLIKFIKEYKINKENYCKQSQFDKKNKEKSDSIHKYRICNKIKLFNLHNEKFILKHDSNINLNRRISSEESPPVSPSKRKFHEYQKIVKNLSNEQNMGKCPRCAMASRIINQPPLDLFPEIELLSNDINVGINNTIKEQINETELNKNINIDDNSNNINILENKFIKFTKSQPFPSINEQQSLTTDLRRSSLHTHGVIQNTQSKIKLTKAFSVDSWQGQLRKQRLIQEISKFQPYGECTSIKCKFKYCLECFCDYHSNQKCKLTASISPSKEDIQNGILQIIKSPKRQYSGINNKSDNNGTRNVNMKRKSLKRLCFN